MRLFPRNQRSYQRSRVIVTLAADDQTRRFPPSYLDNIDARAPPLPRASRRHNTVTQRSMVLTSHINMRPVSSARLTVRALVRRLVACICNISARRVAAISYRRLASRALAAQYRNS